MGPWTSSIINSSCAWVGVEVRAASGLIRLRVNLADLLDHFLAADRCHRARPNTDRRRDGKAVCENVPSEPPG